MTPQQEAFKRIFDLIREGKISHRREVDIFLFTEYGLGVTTANRLLALMVDMGRIKIDEDGVISSSRT